MAERIIVPVGDGSKLNSALKIWKQKSKFITEELRKRKEYEKPSVQKRKQKLKAIYKKDYLSGE
jgi:small subunit ribosomal protein S21